MSSHPTDAAQETTAIESATFRLELDEYAALQAPYVTANPLDKNLDRLLNLATWQSDDCFLIYGESTPTFVERTVQGIQNTGHLIEVMRFISGGERGYSGEEVIDHVPGPIYVMDQGVPLRTLMSEYRVQQIHVTKDCLGLHEGHLAKERVIEASTVNGLLLHDCMSALYETCQRGEGRMPTALLDRFLALLKVNLGVHPERGDVRAHLRAAIFEQICRFIEHNLADLDLSTKTILGRFGVSRASLYRMFEPHGGVRRYITQRRAYRAAIDIASLPHTRGKIRAASERWGFSTQPNFNRTIRRVFGMNPSALASREPQRSPTSMDGERFMGQFAERTAAA